MKYRHLYDRAQELDRATDALTFKLNGVVNPTERAALQSQINLATQRASDAWAHFHDAEYAQRAASAGRPTALATAASSQPAPSAAEIAARRRAETSAFWKRVIAKVNAEMLGCQTDSAPDASREGTSPHDKAPKPDSKAIWKKAVAEVNAGIAGSEPRERDASSSGRRKSGDFLERAMTAAGKHLANTGFSVAR